MIAGFVQKLEPADCNIDKIPEKNVQQKFVKSSVEALSGNLTCWGSL